MSDRERILEALGAGTLIEPQRPFEASGKTWTYADFGARLMQLGGVPALLDDLDELKGKRAWVDADAEPYVKDLELTRVENIWDAEVGFTTADVAVCESGSLLLSAGPGRRRMGSLAPELHVCFVRSENLVCTLEEALPRLTTRTSVLITGSSRTADIEGVLVRGVHGPKEVWFVAV